MHSVWFDVDEHCVCMLLSFVCVCVYVLLSLATNVGRCCFDVTPVLLPFLHHVPDAPLM